MVHDLRTTSRSRTSRSPRPCWRTARRDARSRRSWTLKNAGGLAISAAWVDRIYLSTDAIRGNGDDLLLAQFAQSPPLASGGTRSRTESLAIPDTLALGSYLLFLVVDAANSVPETLGEDDNVLDHPLVIAVAGIPEPGLQTVETFGSISFTTSQAGNSTTNFDFSLEEVVALADVRFVSADALRWEFTGGSTPATLSLYLMNGATEVVKVGQNRFTGIHQHPDRGRGARAAT